MNSFELNILDWIQSVFKSEFMDSFMQFITKFGDHGIFWIAIAVILLIFPKTRRCGLSMGIALLLGLIIGNGILKNVIGRIRPYDLNPAFPLLVERLSDFSFPSGHTLASFEASVAIFIRNRRFGIAAIILAVLVALSRLYLYVHFPTDVIAGAILGIIFAIVGTKLCDYIYCKVKK